MITDGLLWLIHHHAVLFFIYRSEETLIHWYDIVESKEWTIAANDFLSASCGFYSEDCIEWLLLWQESNKSSSSSTSLIGMVTLIRLHDSLFVANLSVLPSMRRHGYGVRLLHAAQDRAIEQSLMALSGTVDGHRRDLIGYYTRLGAKIDANLTGYGSSGDSTNSNTPSSVRLRSLITLNSNGHVSNESRAPGHVYDQRIGEVVPLPSLIRQRHNKRMLRTITISSIATAGIMAAALGVWILFKRHSRATTTPTPTKR
jgi:GNAT superfamily N-acetyltransferase